MMRVITMLSVLAVALEASSLYEQQAELFRESLQPIPEMEFVSENESGKMCCQAMTPACECCKNPHQDMCSPSPPAEKPCPVCVEEFARAGGCEVWKNKGDVGALIPKGCDRCGTEAAEKCGIKPEEDATCDGCITLREEEFKHAIESFMNHMQDARKHMKEDFKNKHVELHNRFTSFRHSVEIAKLKNKHDYTLKLGEAKQEFFKMQEMCTQEIEAKFKQYMHKMGEARGKIRAYAHFLTANMWMRPCWDHLMKHGGDVLLQEDMCPKECDGHPDVQEAMEEMQKVGQRIVMQEVQAYQGLRKQYEQEYQNHLEHVHTAAAAEIAEYMEHHEHLEEQFQKAVAKLEKETENFCRGLEETMSEQVEAEVAQLQREWEAGMSHVKLMTNIKTTGCNSMIKAGVNAAHNFMAAHVAKAHEMAAAKAEAKFHANAKVLRKAERDLAATAAKNNRAAEKKEEKYAEYVAKESIAVSAASAKAQKKSDKFKKKMADIEAKMEKQTGKAKKKSEARKNRVEKQIARNDAKIEELNAKQEAADEKAALEHKKYELEKETAEADFEEKDAAIKEKFKKDEAKFDKEKADIDNKAKSEAKTNNEKYELEKAEIADEAKTNAEKAKKAQDDITKDYAEKQEAADEAEAAHQKLVKAEHEAEDNKRAAWQQQHQATIDADEKAYEEAMAKAADKQDKADQAHDRLVKAQEQSVASQHEADMDFKKEMDADGEIKECATDGSECQDADGACHNMEKDHLFMDCNGYSCTSKHKTDAECDTDGNWAGVEDPLKPTPLKPVTDKCKSLQADLAEYNGGMFADAAKFLTMKGEQVTDCPLCMVGCKEGATRQQMKEGLSKLFLAAEECPPYCIPGTATSTTGHQHADESEYDVQDNNGICVGEGAMKMLAKNLHDIPVYKATGTGDRFAAGISTTMCEFSKKVVNGWFAGAGENMADHH